MLTSYDDIWSTFMDNCKTSSLNLPRTNEGMYKAINNASKLFNNRLRADLKCDDEKESINKLLNDDELLILANYIRLVFLRNEKTFHETLFQPFSKDIGVKNYTTQVKNLESSVSDQERVIDMLIMNTEEDFL
ncbi:hypothetical protein AB1L07_01885 [Niallia alba]|uniref:hypothetical protein n=1 Tax=Niallia alba TaxID=2729105 RepID=UPI0039A3D32A